MNPRSPRQFLPLWLLFLAASASATIVPDPPRVNASSYFLMDANSGHVLIEEKADVPLPPASLTKLMTSYVLAYELDKGTVSNDDLVTVSRNAWAKNFPDSSLMWIEVGEQVSIEDLHRGIVISSGNDSSVAVAEHLSGSEDAFASVMNRHAKELGMTGTNFVNSHGLPDDDHFTTARDLALLSVEFINRFPEQYALYKERDFTFNNIKQPNRNKLLWRDPSVDGLKTGHTREAGYCLVASAVREDMRLVSVVLGAESVEARTRESKKLLEYGFRYFDSREMFAPGAEVMQAKVWEGEQESVALVVSESVRLTIPKGKFANVDTIQEVNQELIAPLEAGKVYGTLRLELDDQVLFTAPLVAGESVEQAGFFSRLLDSGKRRVLGLIDQSNE